MTGDDDEGLDRSFRSAQAHPFIGPTLARFGVVEVEDLEALPMAELMYLSGAFEALASLRSPPRTWATVTEAARVLGEKPRTVRAWCSCGALPATRRHAKAPWRIDRGQLAAFVDG